MKPVFQRLTKGILAHLGEDAFLRDEPTIIRIHVSRDVQMVDRVGNVYVAEVVLTIEDDYAPQREDSVRVGGTLVAGVPSGGTVYKIESRISGNGYTSKYIAREA